LSKQKKLGSDVSRRAFLGSSVWATVGSVAMPALGLSHSAETGEQPALHESKAIAFRAAKPVWPRGREKEMNLFVGFRAVFAARSDQDVYLRVAGATLYRIYLNGVFLAWGPARGPHSFFRLDSLPLGQLLAEGKNLLWVEVAGYNVNSYYVLDQPSFLQAEIVAGSSVLAATGAGSNQFVATVLTERLQKVQRYSFQRSFSEVYHLDGRLEAWRERIDASVPSVPALDCASFPPPALIPRRVPFPVYAMRQPELITAQGTFRWAAKGPKSLAEDHSVPYGAKISPTLLGFPEQELTVIPYLELQRTESVDNLRVDEPYLCDEPVRLRQNEFRILDFGINVVGFFGASVTVHAPAKLYFTFDETLTHGDVDFTRLMCVNIVAYTLAPGSYKLETFEPYTLRFLKLMVLEGECAIGNIFLREYTAPDVWTAHFRSSDEGLNLLFTAGRETYRSNAVDFFTDTPSRERAGWLCDSSFTASVSPLLSGHTSVEKCFFENFYLPREFSHIPEGMLPACYPADHFDGGFVPNWALWFLIQLEQYLARSGDRALVDALQPRVMKLLDYFQPFQNRDGLLESLKGTVFIEWSKSNDYVQDVSYPTNMLYAAALDAVGRMYRLPALTKQANALRDVIRAQSFDGDFFVDNAVRQGGKLVRTGNRTETCQYYAFYFDTASPERYPKLWETLYTEFGPARRTTNAFPEIAPSNAFMGNVLRLELLSRIGLTDQLASEAKSYYLYMAELTGTFWENTGNEASMDHAFGSHVIVALYRDVLGLYRLDMVNKLVHVRFTSSSLQTCEGRIPVAEGFVSLAWTKTQEALVYQLDLPAGYRAEVENLATLPAVRKQFPRGEVAYGYKIEGGYK
jgi:alpha-L-rhamnosidase